jgi:hypothetical protein
MKTSKKITVVSNGNQAPYGLGETIAEYNNTRAGIKKAMRRAAYWYTPATVVVDGQPIAIDWSVVRPCDKGYKA